MHLYAVIISGWLFLSIRSSKLTLHTRAEITYPLVGFKGEIVQSEYDGSFLLLQCYVDLCDLFLLLINDYYAIMIIL